MRQVVRNVLLSLTTEKGGYSARKLSALVGVITAIYITGRFGDDRNVVELTMVWLSFALLLLGVVTIEQLIGLRTGSQPSASKSVEKSTE